MLFGIITFKQLKTMKHAPVLQKALANRKRLLPAKVFMLKEQDWQL